MNIRKVRSGVAEWFYHFENARTKLGIIQTILLILTFVKVYGFSDFESALILVVFIIGLLIFGWILDWTKFQHAFIKEMTLRNPILTETHNNTNEILRLLK